MEFDEYIGKTDPDGHFGHPEDFSNFIMWLKRFYDVQNYISQKILGHLAVRTSVDGKFCSCSVSLSQGEAQGFPLIKRISDSTGLLEIDVPAGDWQIDVSHGFKVGGITETVTVPPNSTASLEFPLETFMPLHGVISGDFHQHSIYSSPAYGGTDDVTDSPHEISLTDQAKGCGFSALSDHHNILGHGDWLGEASSSFTPIISKEISTSNGHVMAMGVRHDVIYDIPPAKDRTAEIMQNEFLRITKDIRDSGGLPQLNHPYSESSATSWPQEFCGILSAFDSIEIYNGAHPMLPGNCNHKGMKMWLDALKRGESLTATAGSDTHYRFPNQYEEIKREIFLIITAVKAGFDKLPPSTTKRAEILLKMYETSYPVFMEWIRCQLGSAGIQNFVDLRSESAANADTSVGSILSAVRSGKVFITNGPVMDIKVQGQGDITADMEIGSNRRVNNVKLHLSDGREISGMVKHAGGHKYTCSITFPKNDAGWVVCTAGEMPFNFAVSNPFYF